MTIIKFGRDEKVLHLHWQTDPLLSGSKVTAQLENDCVDTKWLGNLFGTSKYRAGDTNHSTRDTSPDLD